MSDQNESDQQTLAAAKSLRGLVNEYRAANEVFKAAAEASVMACKALEEAREKSVSAYRKARKAEAELLRISGGARLGEGDE